MADSKPLSERKMIALGHFHDQPPFETTASYTVKALICSEHTTAKDIWKYFRAIPEVGRLVRVEICEAEDSHA